MLSLKSFHQFRKLANVDIGWCHTTSPLFDQYDHAIKNYFESIKSEKTNGLITVTNLNEFIISEEKTAFKL